MIARSTSAAVRRDSWCGPRPVSSSYDQRAERVDIGRRRHRLAAHLFRARRTRGVIGPLPSRVSVGVRAARSSVPLVQDLGDAEVEQLDLPVGRHQRVRRLQVAMDDEVLVRVLNGVARPR